jgi:hypothetical protein
MSQQKLNVMIDSQNIKTVAAALLYLADQAALSIRISGTAEELKAKQEEITKLLSHSRYQPTFVFCVEIDFNTVRGASLANVAGAAQENVAFKLHDFGFRGRQ